MTSTVNLNRLLARLEHNLLAPGADANIQHSQYERNRIGANIEHARAMILTLEKQTATVRSPAERQKMQNDLQEKRELIKKLNTRLREINTAEEEEDDDEDEDEEEEDVLNTYAPARKDTEAGLETGETQSSRIDETTQEGLRSRRTQLQASDNRTAASTSAREQLFSQRPRNEAETAEELDPGIQKTEMLMSHNRTEQEALTTGLLGLAQALKESSMQFSSSLAEEKDVLKRAEKGLDKSAQGMEAAERKMSTLRRMSEGQGWWGRLKLYGMIFGMWVAAFLLVFLGPKLRF